MPFTLQTICMCSFRDFSPDLLEYSQKHLCSKRNCRRLPLFREISYIKFFSQQSTKQKYMRNKSLLIKKILYFTDSLR